MKSLGMFNDNNAFQKHEERSMFQVLPYIGCRNDAKANLHCPGHANSGTIASRPKAKGLT